MLYQSTCIRLLLPNPLYLLLCHYLIIPLCYWYTNLHRVLEKKGRKDDTKALKPTQCNDLTLSFCINMAVMICNDSIVSYIIHMDDQPFLMYSLTISFNKKIQKWQFMHYVCGRPTFTDVFSDFASALNVRSRSSRSSSSSKSNCNRRLSHCLPTIILLLTEQKHLCSPS